MIDRLSETGREAVCRLQLGLEAIGAAMARNQIKT
jgi:hypothetical protein